MPNTLNRKAFLDTLSFSEGTTTNTLAARPHPLSVDDGYDVIVTGVGGPEVFTDYSQHPFAGGRRPKQVKGSLFSTASGRYQHMLVHWPHYRDQLGLPDFGPASQDKWALQLIRERGALPLIDMGNLREALSRCRNIWASLPGAGYGQPEHSYEKLRDYFVAVGGTLA